jgi:GntR family trehalose operon transcriptional repressor
MKKLTFLLNQYFINKNIFLYLSNQVYIIKDKGGFFMAQSKVGVIAQDLVDKIKHQQYQPGDYLPSEHQLMDLYSASRETIRKALN